MRCCPSTKSLMRKKDCSVNKRTMGEAFPFQSYHTGGNPAEHLSNEIPVGWRKVMHEDLNSYMTSSVLRDVELFERERLDRFI